MQFNESDKKAHFKIADKVNDYTLSIYRNDNSTHYREKPLRCLSKENLDEIHNKSISIEKLLLPKFHQSTHGAPVLKSLFAKLVEEKKFCQLDVGAFLSKEKDNLLLHVNQM